MNIFFYRKELQQARQRLASDHQKLSTQLPCDKTKKMREASLTRFDNEINEINIKINKFNMIVPFLNKQKMHYRTQKEVKRILDNLQEYLPEQDDSCSQSWDLSIPLSYSEQRQKTDWGQVWQDIKNVFSTADRNEKKSS